MKKTQAAEAAQSAVIHEDPAFIDELDYFGPADGNERIIVDFTDAVKWSRPGFMRQLIRDGWVVEMESKLTPGMFRMKMPKERWQQIQAKNLAHYQEMLVGMPTPPDPRTKMTGRVEESGEFLSTEELIAYAQQGHAPQAND